MADKEQRRDKFWRTLLICALVISFHGAAFLLLDRFALKKPPKTPLKVQHIKVPKGALAQPGPKQDKPKSASEVKQKKKEEEKFDIKKLDKQIVDLPPSADNRPPEEAKYLSEYNTRTEKETKAREMDKDYKKAANKPARQKEQPRPKGELTAQKLQENHEPTQKATEQILDTPSANGKVAFKEAADGSENKKNTDDKANPYRLKLRPTRTLPQEGEESLGFLDGADGLKLMPTTKELAELLGSPANNYLPDVEEGDGTFLNSREFKYAGFFNRIHKKVSQNWYPQNVLEARDPTGNLYGYKDRETIIGVVLNEKGALLDARVVRQSGVYALDDEALAAFKRAAPFPNPPAALLDGHGRIEFNFGFHIEYGPDRIVGF